MARQEAAMYRDQATSYLDKVIESIASGFDLVPSESPAASWLAVSGESAPELAYGIRRAAVLKDLADQLARKQAGSV